MLENGPKSLIFLKRSVLKYFFLSSRLILDTNGSSQTGNKLAVITQPLMPFLFFEGLSCFMWWRPYVGFNWIWRCLLFRDQFQRSIGLRHSDFGKCRASQNRLHFWPPYRGGDQLRGKPHGFGHTGRKTSHLRWWTPWKTLPRCGNTHQPLHTSTFIAI